MKVLVIPDIHLKLEIINRAREIMFSKQADLAMFLGDFFDDWGFEGNREAYSEITDMLIDFHKQFPSKMCWGNHELAYIYERPCSGTDVNNLFVNQYHAKRIGQEFGNDAAVIHKIDHTLFSHAGLTNCFVERYMSRERNLGLNDKELLTRINELVGVRDNRLINNASPVWARPQDDYRVAFFEDLSLYGDYRQVVGHTPCAEILQEGNLLTVDNFSNTSPDDRWNRRFIIWDTSKETWRYAEENLHEGI